VEENSVADNPAPAVQVYKVVISNWNKKVWRTALADESGPGSVSSMLKSHPSSSTISLCRKSDTRSVHVHRHIPRYPCCLSQAAHAAEAGRAVTSPHNSQGHSNEWPTFLGKQGRCHHRRFPSAKAPGRNSAGM